MKRTEIYSRFEIKNWKRLVAPLLVLFLVAVTAAAGMYAHKYANEAADQKVKYQNSQTEKLKLNTQLNETKLEQVEEQDTHKQEIQKLQDDKKNLEQQLQAKVEQKQKDEIAAAEKIKVAIAPVVTAKLEPVAAGGCGDNTFANYIYMHESSCNLSVTNAEGCIGIGQACPASKLLAICPNLDYACENQFFTAYAVSRYGSWEGAYNSWLLNKWW